MDTPETRRQSDAMLLTAMNHPLAFMSPAERVRMFREAIAPMQAMLVRLHANEIQPRMIVIDRDAIGCIPFDEVFDKKYVRTPLQGDAAELERTLLAQIDYTRAQILGGLE